MSTTHVIQQKKQSLSAADFNRALDSFDRFTVTSHIHPEGDSIGSVLAMHSYLTRIGKKARIVSADPIPARWSTLGSRHWHILESLSGEPQKHDPLHALIVLDSSSPDRVGSVLSFMAPNTKIFNVDHHVSNTYFGDYHYVYERAASAGQLVGELVHERGMTLTSDEARWIYATLLTDTGWFRYDNTNAEVLTLAADLASTGFSVPELNNQLLGTWTVAQLRLLSRILHRVRIELLGTVAWSYVEFRDFAELNLKKTDVERAIDFLRYLEGVRLAFFIAEIHPGEVAVSLRSKGKDTVHDIALEFGGGGHRQAAGFTLTSDIRGTAERILAVIEKRKAEVAS